MRSKIVLNVITLCLCMFLYACSVQYPLRNSENKTLPSDYNGFYSTGTNSAVIKWKDFFKDSNLLALIDTALRHNQELNIMLQEINISKNEVRARKGEYLPFVGAGAAAGIDKVGRYTSRGASDANNEIMPGRKFPEPLPDYFIGLKASWEIDIWKKLRNAKKAAIYRYLASIEGRNFMITNLVAEIATSYYELMALDKQLEILLQSIEIQKNALEIVKMQKIAARTTELAVRKFEAEVLKNQSRQFFIAQQITETENRINFLLGRFPQRINRNSSAFTDLMPDSIQTGIPSDLLQNRTDIRRAELELASAKIDVKVAKAEFYPSMRIGGAVGYQAFNPKYLISPHSLIYSIAGDLVAPLINRNAIKANYYSANSRQVQAIYHYERSILQAYIEVLNQVSNISNLEKSYDLKNREVAALISSIDISGSLFKSARADYMEVLLTQRDALEARFDLIEIKKLQLNSAVNVYRALGGGWN